jgi:hypothetical protein
VFLIRLGWISKDTGSFQRKLNRDGAYFVIDPGWRRAGKQFAPPAPEKCARSAPPIEKPETPNGSKNQKPAAPVGAGVCTANREELQRRPSLQDIKLADLRRLSRLRVLYAEATAEKWLPDSEANLRNFIAAAARATRVKGDSVRVFVGIVRKGLWHHLSGEDEDRATRVLGREREKLGCGTANTIPGWRSFETEKGEGIVQAVLNLAMRRNAPDSGSPPRTENCKDTPDQTQGWLRNSSLKRNLALPEHKRLITNPEMTARCA